VRELHYGPIADQPSQPAKHDSSLHGEILLTPGLLRFWKEKEKFQQSNGALVLVFHIVVDMEEIRTENGAE